MARLLPLALALCGSAFCATPELEAPAYSYAHNAHSEQIVSAVTWPPEHATCYWASEPKTNTPVLDAFCPRADPAAHARPHDATGELDAFGEVLRAAYHELAHDAWVPWASQPSWHNLHGSGGPPRHLQAVDQCLLVMNATGDSFDECPTTNKATATTHPKAMP